MKTPPKIQVDTMKGGDYFTYAAELLKLQPPHLTDEPIIAQMKRIGIEVGKSLDMSKLDPVVRKALDDAPAAGQKLMEWKVPTIARVVNYWSMNTDTMGVYGNDHSQARHRRPAWPWCEPAGRCDLPAQPRRRNRQAARRRKQVHDPLREGRHAAGECLLVAHTLRQRNGFQVGNSLNRFAVSSWMPFKYNPDGSLDLYFQNESPGTDKEANWLPAPKGPFNPTLCGSTARSLNALTGKWNPSPIAKIQGASNPMAQ